METELELQIDLTLESIAQDICVLAKHPQTRQNALFARRAVLAAEVISPFTSATVSNTPTYLTVQIGNDLHIELSPPILQYCNHSCDPNVFFDTSAMEVYALRNIQKGEELTFFYPSTEWFMAQPFDCFCGSPKCLGRIAGADTLSKEVLKRYRLTDFIQSKLSRR